ncbi:MoaD/ThiS family protein [Hoyosella sp. G463]|uniref:Molybdopterin synthase sulfur carrier subunit n=1 Tax=Lolliginicoccus lacisalsi TaxID=2742202 RepID=A0A927JAX8_9ACTN|nr:MoaD/ThiS family protein [Lolliginicoccus lacisalsi]MBD8505829.1 MoaD/ThiS family protein [Lolliginicoccus lacisalsi]
MTVTMRYFAAAGRAAGMDEEELDIEGGATLAELVASLAERSPELARVLGRCQFLVDEQAVSDQSIALAPGCTVDALPPFAGG